MLVLYCSVDLCGSDIVVLGANSRLQLRDLSESASPVHSLGPGCSAVFRCDQATSLNVMCTHASAVPLSNLSLAVSHFYLKQWGQCSYTSQCQSRKVSYAKKTTVHLVSLIDTLFSCCILYDCLLLIFLFILIFRLLGFNCKFIATCHFESYILCLITHCRQNTWP